MKNWLYKLMLIGEESTPFNVKLQLAISFAPIAFLLNFINTWFTENAQFFLFMSMSLLLNMGVGVVKHLSEKTFDYKLFFKKNLEMIVVVVIVYVALEMLRLTAGDNIAGEIFRITIQIMTLLYPISKVLRNIYILTNGKHPPKWLMDNLYDMEKKGDVKSFFKFREEKETSSSDSDSKE